MGKFVRFILVLALLGIVFGAGTGIEAASLASTVKAMAYAVNEGAGSAIWHNASTNMVVLMAPVKSAYQFTILSTNGEIIRDLTSIPGFSGQNLSVYKAVDFVKWMEQSGYSQITATELKAMYPAIPTAIAAAQASIWGMVLNTAKSLTCPMFIILTGDVADMVPLTGQQFIEG